MKPAWFLCLSLCLLLLLPGCGGNADAPLVTSAPAADDSQAVSPKAAELPANFEPALPDAEIQGPETAVTCLASELTFDEDTIRNALTQQGFSGDFRIRCSGRSLKLMRTEEQHWDELNEIVRLYPSLEDYTNTLGGALHNEDYAAWGELPFLPLEDCISAVNGLLEAILPGSTRLSEVYALDAETMAAHETCRTERLSTLAEGAETYPWSKADEAYVLIYRVTAADIPLYAERVTIERALVGGSYLTAVVDASGLLGLYGENLYGLAEPLSEAPAIDAAAAMKRFLGDMRKAIHPEGTKWVSMEYCYLPLPGQDGSTTLTPVWAFAVSTPPAAEGAEGFTIVRRYLYHAATGEVLYAR